MRNTEFLFRSPLGRSQILAVSDSSCQWYAVLCGVGLCPSSEVSKLNLGAFWNRVWEASTAQTLLCTQSSLWMRTRVMFHLYTLFAMAFFGGNFEQSHLIIDIIWRQFGDVREAIKWLLLNNLFLESSGAITLCQTIWYIPEAVDWYLLLWFPHYLTMNK